MRAAPLTFPIVLALVFSTAAPLQAQGGSPQLRSAVALDAVVPDSAAQATQATVARPSAPRLVGRVLSDSVARGPRLPQVVHSVTPRLADDEAAAAAPKNIVIPVTTAVIVLAVVVLLLLID